MRLELLELAGSRVLDGADPDPLGGQRRAELLAPELGLHGVQLADANSNLVERLLRRSAVGEANGETREHLVERPATRTMKNSSRFGEDPAELHAFEQGLGRIGGEVEDALLQGPSPRARG